MKSQGSWKEGGRKVRVREGNVMMGGDKETRERFADAAPLAIRRVKDHELRNAAEAGKDKEMDSFLEPPETT